jgi:D-beta-D-heptose 7-phosphate kinase/D-beta-D-heptose 1-phosphate adenosyltransferase
VTLRFLTKEYVPEYDLFFANGGDQNNDSFPEVPIWKEVVIGLLEGLSDKIQSSSWLLKK